MFCSIKSRSVKGSRGQASVEAALVLPVLIFLLALIVQPACVLYTRVVMQSTAAEACRLITTAPGSGVTIDDARDFMVRRLSAVPPIDVFHLGGHEGWSVGMNWHPTSHQITVRIRTYTRPLPFIGALISLLGSTDDATELRVEVSTTARPDWLGGQYEEWIHSWNPL